jgi:hypothetical protein
MKKHRVKLGVFVVLTFVCGVAGAQQADVAAVKQAVSEYPLGRAVTSPFSLLDASRMSWSHSYSISFFSGGNGSGSLGLLNSTMTYELSSKLSLAINLGIMHNVGSLFGSGNRDATVLPGFAVDYHPSNRFRMSLVVQQYNGLLQPSFNPVNSTWRRPVHPY